MVAPTATTLTPYAWTRGTGASAWYLDNTLITFLATGDDTNGQFGLLEFRGRPGAEPPPHVHHGEDECFYVLDGELSFRIAGQTVLGHPGSWVVVPRGTIHLFTFESDQATLLVSFTPAGFELFFQEMCVPAQSTTTPPAPSGPPDIPRLIAAAATYGCEFVGPA